MRTQRLLFPILFLLLLFIISSVTLPTHAQHYGGHGHQARYGGQVSQSAHVSPLGYARPSAVYAVPQRPYWGIYVPPSVIIYPQPFYGGYYPPQEVRICRTLLIQPEEGGDPVQQVHCWVEILLPQ